MHEKGDAEIPAEQTDKEERTGRNFQSDSSNEVYTSRLPKSKLLTSYFFNQFYLT